MKMKMKFNALSPLRDGSYISMNRLLLRVSVLLVRLYPFNIELIEFY